MKILSLNGRERALPTIYFPIECSNGIVIRVVFCWVNGSVFSTIWDLIGKTKLLLKIDLLTGVYGQSSKNTTLSRSKKLEHVKPVLKLDYAGVDKN